jgi:hypothetical protein
MKHLYFLPVVMLAAPAFAQDSQDNSGSGQTIVVTGTSLAQTERNLRECLARRCPPDEDIAATLAHAENQFVAGDYAAARRTTKASLAQACRTIPGRRLEPLPRRIADRGPSRRGPGL